MPTIKYDGTGDATKTDRDATLAELRSWTSAQSNRTLGSIEMREDVDAISVHFEWEVPVGDVSDRMGSLDSFVTDDSRIPADISRPTDGGATVEY